MNVTDVSCVICRGFNGHFDIPVNPDGGHFAFRTAVVIKKKSFYDYWDVYDDLFWRVLNGVVQQLCASMRIDCPGFENGVVESYGEWRAWQERVKDADPTATIDVPTQIRLFRDSDLICLVSLEDWSDVGHCVPYELSYTFSFYSNDEAIDCLVSDSMTSLLSADPSVGDLSTLREPERTVAKTATERIVLAMILVMVIVLLTSLGLFTSRRCAQNVRVSFESPNIACADKIRVSIHDGAAAYAFRTNFCGATSIEISLAQLDKIDVVTLKRFILASHGTEEGPTLPVTHYSIELDDGTEVPLMEGIRANDPRYMAPPRKGEQEYARKVAEWPLAMIVGNEGCEFRMNPPGRSDFENSYLEIRIEQGNLNAGEIVKKLKDYIKLAGRDRDVYFAFYF